MLTVRLYFERIDSTRYCRVCSKCIRLRQFWHFSHKQASAKTQADMRTCLDCYIERYNPKSRGQRIKWFFGETIVACEKCRRLVRVVDKEVFAHGCRVGRKPVNWASREPNVNRIRDTLDRLEERLPPRRLLDWRTDDPEDKLEDTLVLLEGCAKEHEALAGGAT
ncbi:hypothetical protein BDD12DRAFT_855026 [Trichophaea hybrida]|nr:hypothetical protein BDD12DRAFT_855026 [Trichophaea hybrida]